MSFQSELCEKVGTKYALLVNSGSSANLWQRQRSHPPCWEKKGLMLGDEVIAIAAGFPTTLNPIILNGLVPVFVDADIPTYNVNIEEIEEAIGPRTKALSIAHTLGNPFDISRIVKIAEKYDLYLIEDNCDALGSTCYGKNTGTFGHLATCSFYPAQP